MYGTNNIYWSEATIRIGDLQDFEHNPRRLSTKDFTRLVQSLKEDGYHQRLLVNQDNKIIGGHQRKRAFLQAGYTLDNEIPVLKPNRLLSEDEFKRINIRDNLPFGEWDMDTLANKFDTNELITWGMPAEWVFKTEEPETESEDTTQKAKDKSCPNCGWIL